MKKISLATILSILFVFSGTLYASVLTFSIKPGPDMSSYKARAVVCGAVLLGTNAATNFALNKVTTLEVKTVLGIAPLSKMNPVCSVWVTKDGKLFYHMDTNPVTINPGFANYYFTVNVQKAGANLEFDGTYKN